jgi:hypothetical protein
MNVKPNPWLRSFSDEWANTQPAITPLAEPAQEDSGVLLHLHRVTQVQVSEAANDMDAEDEMLSSSMTSLELLAISFGLVFAIAASIYQPWQWF